MYVMKRKFSKKIPIFLSFLLIIASFQSCLHSLINADSDSDGKGEIRIDLLSNVSTTDNTFFIGKSGFDSTESNVEFSIDESGTLKKMCMNFIQVDSDITLTPRINNQNHSSYLTIFSLATGLFCIEELNTGFTSTDKFSLHLDNGSSTTVEWGEAYLIYEK